MRTRVHLCGISAVFGLWVVVGLFVAPVIYYGALSPVHEFLDMTCVVIGSRGQGALEGGR